MDPGSLTLLGNLAADNANIQIDQASFSAGEALFITDCQAADLFCATNVSQAGGKTTIAHSNSCNEEWSESGGVITKLGGTNRLSKAYQDDASVARFITATYFVGVDTSLPAADQVPALYSQINGAAPQPLVEGVRDMQLLFGVDSSGDDRIVDQYIPANNGYFGTTDNWGQVVSVRVGIVAESPTDALPENYTIAYQLPIAADATFTPANQSAVTYDVAAQTATYTTNQRRMRQSFNTTFALRNRLP
jgi:type IV pilus assembly protein PilW